MKTKYLLAAVLLGAGLCGFAQQPNDFKTYKTQASGKFDARHLMQTLVGEGVVVRSFSVTKASSDEAYGFFEDTKAVLGMKKGLIMTTGGIGSLCSGNTSKNMSNAIHREGALRDMTHIPENRDTELEKLLKNGQKTFDACVIELDIIPTADTLSFNYVFGSEEYDEFVGSNYNDVFAFFISGKGIEGQKNLAVVPGTKTPVSVNTINNGGSGSYHVSASNPTYYVSNVDGNLKIEYDGLTKLMEIRQAVTPYENYHLKLAIADVSDNSYDSGVLLEGHSFVSYEKSYNVLYDKNSCEIEKGYKSLLDNLAAAYKKNYSGKILITGHTDNEGDEKINSDLSCCRANAVADYLKTKGIKTEQLIVDCKGETMPRYSNNTEEGKHMNRRVEIKITDGTEQYEKRKAEEDTKAAAETSKLLSNFPNPFTTSTTIEAYLLQDVKDARIMISDMSGNTIKVIYLLERGKTSALFDGSNLVNGTYLATLITDGKNAGTIKMIAQN